MQQIPQINFLHRHFLAVCDGTPDFLKLGDGWREAEVGPEELFGGEYCVCDSMLRTFRKQSTGIALKSAVLQLQVELMDGRFKTVGALFDEVYALCNKLGPEPRTREDGWFLPGEPRPVVGLRAEAESECE